MIIIVIIISWLQGERDQMQSLGQESIKVDGYIYIGKYIYIRNNKHWPWNLITSTV